MEEKPKNFKYCELCQSPATSLCFQCSHIYYFCDSCYKFVHEKKENSNHKKEKIDYYLPIDTRCPQHQNVPLNLFCIDEKGNILNYITFQYI